MTHTQEKLQAHHDHGWLVISSDDESVYIKIEKGSAATKQMPVARRLVACWNACEDGELEYLEGVVSLGSTLRKEMEKALTTKELYQRELCAMEAERDALKQTNVELLEALKRVCTHGKRTSSQIDADWDYARAAIARAEKGQV